MVSIFRHGLNADNVGPIAKASFEETPQMFMKAAQHGELDPVRGLSANVMCGQEGQYGTSSFSTLLDIDKLKGLKIVENSPTPTGVEPPTASIKEECSYPSLSIPLDVGALDGGDSGGIDNTYNPGF